MRVHSLDEVFSLFESRTNLEKGIPPGNPNRVYRLDRMRQLCDAFNRPQNSYRVVHLAGSKGKGSTAAYIAALLSTVGRRVGVYSSPHLRDYRERFRIENEAFPEAAAMEVASHLLERLPRIEDGLPGKGGATTFELLTLFAFLLFRKVGCDTVVLEVGLGGRLDATNVVATPQAVVFTPIELEHVEILGPNLRAIATEKAGILKKGIRAWTAQQSWSAGCTLSLHATRKGVKLTRLGQNLRSVRSLGEVRGDAPLFGWSLEWRGGREEVIRLSMGGRVQAENAALALLLTRDLEPSLANDLADEGRRSLSGVSLPGRFEFLRRQPPVVIDGAHTPRSVKAVAEAFTAISGPEQVLLFGSVAGKKHEAMARILCEGRRPAFRDVVISTPGFFKPSDPASVADAFCRTGASTRLEPDPADAWRTAQKLAGKNRGILVTGSFFMVAEIARLAASLL